MSLTKPDKGWAWVVMVASFGAYFLTGGLMHSTGVIHISLLERFEENQAKTSLASGLYVCCMMLSGIFGSVIIQRFSCRVSFIVGSVTAAVGFLACVFAPSLDGVIICYGIIAGCGAGICYTTQHLAIAMNFDKQRNLAMGVAASGASIGGFLLSQPIQMARDKYGDKGYFFILSGIALNVSVFGSLCFPSYLEEMGKKFKNGNEKRTSSRINQCLNCLLVLKTPSFIFLCISLLFVNFGVCIMYIHLPNFSISTNNSALDAAFLLSVCGLCGTFSRFLSGVLANADNVDETIIYSGTLSLIGTTTIMLPLYGTSYGGQLSYSVFLGLYSGCCYVLQNSLTVKSIGLPNVAIGVGIGMVSSGVGISVGSLTAGYILDNGGSYNLVFVLAGAALILAAIGGFASEFIRLLEQKHGTEQLKKKYIYSSVDLEIDVATPT